MTDRQAHESSMAFAPPAADVAASDIEELRSRTRGDVLMPGDDGYDDARRIWNAMIDRRPGLIVKCLGVADVIDAVRFASDRDLPISIRGGGHHVAGHAVCDGGVMLDLSLMRAVRVDPDRRLAWVEGGALWRDVDRETSIFGLATPGGVISATGFVVTETPSIRLAPCATAEAIFSVFPVREW